MSDVATHGARGKSRVFLSLGFRPFFLAAGLWAAAAIALWVVLLTAGFSLPSRFDPLSWHIHEMLFGFVMAAVAGFLLTAIPNWTGRPPISGGPLALLLGLWILGRIVCLISATLPWWFAAAADLAFPVALIAAVTREIIGGKNWRNLPMIAPLIVLGIANLLMYLESIGVGSTGLGWRLGLSAIIVLISVVAGRIVPTFTRNWLMQRQSVHPPPASGLIDRAALGGLHAGLFGWTFFPDSRAAVGLLLFGAALNLWRLIRWRGIATTAEPLLLILHIGYLWLVMGVAMLGFSILDVDIPLSGAVHALTVGAIASMILAVMTRVTRGHTGRDLKADRATGLIYILITIAAITRVAAAFSAAWSWPLIIVSAVFWVAAFGGFVFNYGPMLVLPRANR